MVTLCKRHEHALHFGSLRTNRKLLPHRRSHEEVQSRGQTATPFFGQASGFPNEWMALATSARLNRLRSRRERIQNYAFVGLTNG